MRKMPLLFISCFLLFYCTRQNNFKNLLPTETNIINDKAVINEASINANSFIAPDSIAVINREGEKWFIGQVVNDDVIRKSNIQIDSALFGVVFGPIKGYVDDNIKIGWNNQNRILYIELLSGNFETIDGIRLGDSKEKIKDALGLPYSESSNEYRYQNIEFEVIGIIFQFIDDRASNIVLFSYL